MKGTPSAVIWIYSRLLMFYPASFRKRFREEMILDFSDMAADAKEQGFLSFLFFLLLEARDLPISLLRAHLAEDPMEINSGWKLARTTLRSSLAFGLAFAVMQTIYSLFSAIMSNQGWMFLLRIANARGWHLDYSAAAQTVLHFSGLIFGSVFAGALLALLFSDARRIRGYVLATLLCWAIPLVVLRAAGILLQTLPLSLDPLFSISSRLIIGLGFGLMYIWIVNERKRTAWLLLAGAAGFYIASALVVFLLPLVPASDAGIYGWRDFAAIWILFALQGAIVGAILGAVSALPARRSSLVTPA